MGETTEGKITNISLGGAFITGLTTTPPEKAFITVTFQVEQVSLNLNPKKVVLEVMKAFTDPLTPGAIAEHLTAVNWSFEGVHPRVAVKKALKDLAQKGTIRESDGKYEIATPPPVEAPPLDAEASIKQGRQKLEASMSMQKVVIKASVDSSTARNLFDIQDDKIVGSIGIQFQDHSLEWRSRLESILQIISDS